jgi:hypothetical protein
MKNLKAILFMSLLAAAFTSCEEDDEKFSGSPVGNNNIETLHAVLDTGDDLTDVDFALTDQEIDFKVTLPHTFSDTVNVEVTTISDSGRRVRESIEIKPDSIFKRGKIRAAGGAIFDTNFKMYVSGIALQTPEPFGTHYLMDSNEITIGTGSSVIPDQDLNRLKIKIVWPNVSASNSLQLVIGRPTLADVPQNQLAADGRQHLINVTNTSSTNSGAISTIPGEYTFKIKALALPAEPVDMPYRVIIVYPDGKSKVFSGVLNNLTVATPLTDVLKVTKNADGTFVLTDLTN